MGASAARKAQRLRDGTTKPEDLPSSISASPETETKAGADNAALAKSDPSQEPETHGKNVRFIAFVGNLPYSATKEALEKHFKAVEPASIRLISSKEDPKKSKGFAFLEFEKYDRMKFCLEKLHHSVFDDGISEPRKINIELTAGGGGKTSHRKQKLVEKNQKLNDQRRRKFEQEMSEKNERSAKRVADAPQNADAIHPSRRRRMD